MIVLDASATVELLLNTPTGATVAERVRPESETLHAPHLLDVEVTQVIRRFKLAGLLDAARASSALLDLTELDVTRYPHDVLVPRIWQLHTNLSAYDATYVALAEALGAVLLTTDARLAKASVRGVTIDLVGP